jgi:hypothetical protein
MSTNPSKRYGSPDVPKISNVNDDDVQQFQQIIRERKGMSFLFNISMPTFLVNN